VPPRHVGREAPVCPLCNDGPCQEPFERGPYVFPDRLRRSDDDPSRADDVEPEPKPKRITGRAHHGPENDRMHRPSEDRSA